MVFVYFAFWGLQEEFSTLPCSPCFLHNFGLLLYHSDEAQKKIKIKINNSTEKIVYVTLCSNQK
jgi:hypothetical protein